MSSDCTFLNPLRRDGTSQRQRAVAALEPSFARVDERGLDDLLVYARRYAEILRYYSASNTVGGDWAPFVENDISAVVSLIKHLDLQTTRTEFEQALQAVETASPAGALTAYAQLFVPIAALAVQFDTWHRSANEGLSLRRALDRLISAALNEALRDALVCNATARVLDPGIVDISERTAVLGDDWVLTGIQVDPSLIKSPSRLQVARAVGRMRAVFERFHEALVFLVGKASEFLQETVTDFPGHQPHMALFLAFLKLYARSQDHLNTLTGAHLDFYYEEVLRLERRGAIPDTAHLLFTLAKNFEPHAVAADTRLKGKSPAGVELTFGTDSELVVNKALVDEAHGLKSVFVETDQSSGEEVVVNIFAAPDADSADGIGAEIEDEEGRWATFGSRTMPFAEIGFAVASPVLLLSEGRRTINVVFHFTDGDLLTHDAHTELRRNVRIYGTGEKGWMELAVRAYVRPAAGAAPPDLLDYQVVLDPADGPLVRYDESTHTAGFDTEHPVLKFVLDNDGLSASTGADPTDPTGADTVAEFSDVETYAANSVVSYEGYHYRNEAEIAPSGSPPDSTTEWTRQNKLYTVVDYSDEIETYPANSIVRHDSYLYVNALAVDSPGVTPGSTADWARLDHSYPYKYFQALEIADVVITVDVEGVTGLVLENDVGVLDPAKPFLPFGPIPKVGSSFLIGSAEVFGKPLTSVTLHTEWADLPSVNLTTHYAGYSSPPANNEAYKAALAILEDGTWRGFAEATGFAAQSLFGPTGTGAAPNSSTDMTLPLTGPLASSDGTLSFQKFGTALRRGFMRLQLQQHFGHATYPTTLATAITAETTPPNPPYTPLMSSLKLDYTAERSLGYGSASKADFEDRIERIFQIGPFGHREIYPIPADPTATDTPIDRTLVPLYNVTATDAAETSVTAEGSLLVGIKGLVPAQNLSLLFRMAEGSEDPDGDVQDVVWSYFSNEEWTDFGASEIVSDGTRGLIGSGVILFEIPKDATASVSALPPGLHWLKASVPSQTAAIPMAVAVHSQAIAASFVEPESDNSHLSQPLPADTIVKLKRRDAAIKAVRQPFASFGGRTPESAEAFRVRVSERLRHKHRAITIFDYERLVLEQFPEVYKVKCLNHAEGYDEHVPGSVRVLVVPDLRNQNAVDPLKPRLSRSTRTAIVDYLTELASDFVTIDVSNPSYEEVGTRFTVRFRPGRDKGLYTTRLQEDLVRFLSPWLHDTSAELTFGGSIHRSEILHFVEELEYVDFLTDFKLDHLVPGDPRLDVEEAIATSSSAALVSAPTHGISHDLTSCDDDA